MYQGYKTDTDPNIVSRRNIIGSSVHLDNLNLLILHLLTQFIIDGGQLLTVATPGWKFSKTFAFTSPMNMTDIPRGVEIHEDILVALSHEFVKVLGYGDLDGGVGGTASDLM